MHNQERVYNRSKFGAFLDAFRHNPHAQGLRGSLYATIDHLTHFSGPAEIVETASALSLIVLRMDWALQKGDHETVEACRRRIENYADDWMIHNDDRPAEALAGTKPAHRRKRAH
jgi:hypothetical protein